MIDYICPKCKTSMSSPDSMSGQSEICPKCQNQVKVLSPEELLVEQINQPSRISRPTKSAKRKTSTGKKQTDPIRLMSIVAGILLLCVVVLIMNLQGYEAFVIAEILIFLVVAFGLACIPGMIARGKTRQQDINKLAFVGLIIPICWLVALIWAFIDKPLPTKSIKR